MKYTFFSESVDKLVRQRNFSYVVVAALLVCNAILASVCFMKVEKIIVIPSLQDITKKYEIHGNEFSDNYLVDWANALISNLLTANPDTVDRKIKSFLEWAVHESDLSSALKKNTQIIKQDKISTVFYPKDFVVNRDQSQIKIKGDFFAYLGRDKSPVVAEKTYLLGYQILPNGIIGITEFMEKTNE